MEAKETEGPYKVPDHVPLPPARPFRSPLDWLNFFLADVRGGLARIMQRFELRAARGEVFG